MTAADPRAFSRLSLAVLAAVLMSVGGAVKASAAEPQPARSASPVSVELAPAQLIRTPARAECGLSGLLPLSLHDRAFGCDVVSNTIYECDLDEPETLTARGSITTDWTGTDFGNDGDFSFMYVIGPSNKLCKLAIATGGVTEIGAATPYGSEAWTRLGMDPSTGTMYASSSSGSHSSLCTINLSTGAATRIGETTNGPYVIDIAVHSAGVIYGLDLTNDNLLSINKATGAGTVIGPIGFDANYTQGMDFDWSTGTLYLAAFNDDTDQAELRTANLNTGATTLVRVLGATSPGGLVDFSDLAVATKAYVEEEGTTWVDHNWTSINLTEPFIEPIVVAGPPTSNGWAPGVIRVRNVTRTSFQMKFQEWDYLDGYHCPELVHWIAVERGTWHSGSLALAIAEKFSTSKTNVFAPRWVGFPMPFAVAPVVLAQVITYNGSDAVTDRICAVYPGGMHFSMQEQEASGGHASEQIGYIAMRQDISLTVLTPNAVTHKPYLLANSWGQQVVYLREEQSKDSETVHWTPERVGALGGHGQPPLIADIRTCHGADPCSLRCTLLSQDYWQETDAVSVNHQWQTVNSSSSFVDPGEIRVRSVTPSSFQIRFQEWDYLDGLHCPEQVRWIAFERGAWDMGGWQIRIANEYPMSNANVLSPTWITLPLTLDSNNLVIGIQQTANGASAITERISNLMPGGFNVALQEEEAANGVHAEETLGYFVSGSGSGGVPISSAAARMVLSRLRIGTVREAGSVPKTDWTVYVVEEQSLDAEVVHCPEVIGTLQCASAPPGTIDFVADMQTCIGTDPCSLRCEYGVTAGGSTGKAQRPRALGAAGAGLYSLLVGARSEDGSDLSAVEIAVGQAVAEGLPLTRAYRPGETVTLSAPASITDGAGLLVFSHWEVDRQPAEAGQAMVQVEMTGDREAVTVYVSSDAR